MPPPTLIRLHSVFLGQRRRFLHDAPASHHLFPFPLVFFRILPLSPVYSRILPIPPVYSRLFPSPTVASCFFPPPPVSSCILPPPPVTFYFPHFLPSPPVFCLPRPLPSPSASYRLLMFPPDSSCLVPSSVCFRPLTSPHASYSLLQFPPASSSLLPPSVSSHILPFFYTFVFHFYTRCVLGARMHAQKATRILADRQRPDRRREEAGGDGKNQETGGDGKRREESVGDGWRLKEVGPATIGWRDNERGHFAPPPIK